MASKKGIGVGAFWYLWANKSILRRRKTWVYFLQEKSEALTAFKNFKVLVEKEANSPIKVLRSDRSGEYNSHEFVNFCETHGIKRQLTDAYTP
ncbi:hypothetical protein CR513_20082, partial [Mucuna pruriens]